MDIFFNCCCLQYCLLVALGHIRKQIFPIGFQFTEELGVALQARSEVAQHGIVHCAHKGGKFLAVALQSVVVFKPQRRVRKQSAAKHNALEVGELLFNAVNVSQGAKVAVIYDRMLAGCIELAERIDIHRLLILLDAQARMHGNMAQWGIVENGHKLFPLVLAVAAKTHLYRE